MLKLFKNKLIVALITATSVGSIGGISMKTSSVFYNENTTIKKSKASNIKENYTKNVAVDSENANRDNADKNLNSSSDETTKNDDLQDNITSSNKQEPINSKTGTTNNNNNNQQTDTSSQVIESNNNINTEIQNSTNVTSGVNIYYDRTTSIYANNNITLLRVEYYVNNKLTYYSVVEQFDATTKSYIEKIYQCNRETNIDPLIRTDVYVNGNLVRSY